MKQKLLIYIGIALLITGIVLRATDTSEILGLILLLSGVALKTTYIVLKMVQKEYIPGWELLLLASGLGLFFYSKNMDWDYHYLLMALGITLKATFVVLFIRKTRRSAKAQLQA